MYHRGQKAHEYRLKFKITVIKYAEIHGNRATERKFGVD